MAARDELDRRAVELASRLSDELVESSEQVDFQMGTYLLAALTAELGQRVQARCWEQARRAIGESGNVPDGKRGQKRAGQAG